jgi:hypothetical protein
MMTISVQLGIGDNVPSAVLKTMLFSGMMIIHFINLYNMLVSLFKNRGFYKFPIKTFTGKTETGWKFTTPTLRMKRVTPIYPPPGYDLEIPSKYVEITQNGQQRSFVKG